MREEFETTISVFESEKKFLTEEYDRKIIMSESQCNLFRKEAEEIKTELRILKEENEKMRIEFNSYRSKFSETEWQSLNRRIRELEANSNLLILSQMRVNELEGIIQEGTRKVRVYMASYVLVCAELEAIKMKFN